MSTEQIDLRKSIERYEKSATQREEAQESTAVVAGSGSRPMCLGCDDPRPIVDVVGSASRAREIARVVGDNNGHILACADCIDLDSGMHVESTVRAAQLARGGRV